MDLLWLYRETIAGFCLVTGDQDFTALVLRLRNQGSKVYCIGKPSKAEALAKVCTEFLLVEQLSVPVAYPLQKKMSAQKPAKPEKKVWQTKTDANKSHLDPALTRLLTQAATKIMEEKSVEWVSLPHLGSCLKQLDAGFSSSSVSSSNKLIFPFPRYKRRYYEHLVYEHQDFDIKGLTQGSYTFDLERIFVDLRIDPKAPHQTSADLLHIPETLRAGNHSIWDYLTSEPLKNQHFVILGPPGSGKTTLLKHMALSLVTRKKALAIRKRDTQCLFCSTCVSM